MLTGSASFNAATFNENAFRSSISVAAQAYADVILQVAKETGVSPFLIAAIGDRETGWGTSKDCNPKGAGCLGDSAHGHGLMQIDDRYHQVWLATHDWTDPYTNVKYAIDSIFLPGLTQLQNDGFSGEQANQMAVAAYNAGVHAVEVAVQGGQSPDAKTTGANYSQDVLGRASSAQSAYASAAGVGASSQPA